VFEIRYDTLEDWITWLRERGLGNKSIANQLAAFRSFYTWFRRGRELEFPAIEWPTVKLPPRKRRPAMDLGDRANVIAAIPNSDQGIYIAMKMGIRPAEARAARIGNYNFASGELEIIEALKGSGSGAARGPTKIGEAGIYPVSIELRDWIAEQVPTERRFKADAQLFPNPRTGNPYSSQRLGEIWAAACKKAEVPYIPPYRSTKHSSFTALREAGVPRDEIQALARHLDPRTTDIYDVSDDQRRRRAMGKLAKIERTTVRQQQERVAQLRKPPDSLKSRGREWRPGRESNPRPPA